MVVYEHLCYRMIPYNETIAADTCHKVGAMMRRRVMDFPRENSTGNIDDQ